LTVPQFAETASALYPLTGDVLWQWELNQKLAFAAVKQAVTNFITINRFRPEKPVVERSDRYWFA
jgi:hypothetical protein